MCVVCTRTDGNGWADDEAQETGDDVTSHVVVWCHRVWSVKRVRGRRWSVHWSHDATVDILYASRISALCVVTGCCCSRPCRAGTGSCRAVPCGADVACYVDVLRREITVCSHSGATMRPTGSGSCSLRTFPLQHIPLKR